MNISHKFSGHLNSNLFIRANGKTSIAELWSRFVVPIVNQQFSDLECQQIKGSGSWDECLNELLNLGAIYVDQKRMCSEFVVTSENVVRFHLLPRRFDMSLFDYDRDVIFQNSDFIVINKPAWFPVHPTLDNIRENLLFCLQQKQEGIVSSVHRLDMETTGLIIFSKGKSARSYFQELFSQRKINKTYKAVVTGAGPPPGYYRHWMRKDLRSPKVIIDHEQPNHVVVELKILNRMPFFASNKEANTILEIELLTGKTHQIRSQLAHLGSPLVADTLYGGPPFAQGAEYPHFLLHAYQLEFVDQHGQTHIFKNLPRWHES